MAFQILLNFFIAMVWMFLTTSFTASTFIIGYIIGAIMIYMMRRYFKERFYFLRIWAIIKLTLILLWELFLSNVAVLKVVLRPTIDAKPCIFKYPTELRRDWEITLLANLITLTPGTLVLHVSEDQQYLYIHAIDVEDIGEEIDSIRQTFEKAIKEIGAS